MLCLFSERFIICINMIIQYYQMKSKKDRLDRLYKSGFGKGLKNYPMICNLTHIIYSILKTPSKGEEALAYNFLGILPAR